MPFDRRQLLSRLEKMAFDEQRAIRAEVDAVLFKPGWRSSPDLISMSAVTIAAGLRRATARIANEAWAVAEKKDRVSIADAVQVAKHLRIRMVGYYRQRLMSDRASWSPEVTVKACRDLSETLRHICEEMLDQLARGTAPLPPALLLDIPDIASAGRGAAGPEAALHKSVGSALLPPAALVPLAPTTPRRLSLQHLFPQRPLRQNPFRQHPSLTIPASPGAAAAASAEPIDATSTIIAAPLPPSGAAAIAASVPAAPLSEASAILMPLAAAPVLEAAVPAPVPSAPLAAAFVPVALAPEAPWSLGASGAPSPSSSAGDAASPAPPGFTPVDPIEVLRKRTPPDRNIDLARLRTVLSEVHNSLGSVWIDCARRRVMLREIAAIEAFLQRKNPHRGMLLGMVRRLPPALKMVRLDEAARSVESLIELRPMPPSTPSLSVPGLEHAQGASFEGEY
jgi:hypothetical protein